MSLAESISAAALVRLFCLVDIYEDVNLLLLERQDKSWALGFMRHRTLFFDQSISNPPP